MICPSQAAEFGIKLRPFSTNPVLSPLFHDCLLLMFMCVVTIFHYKYKYVRVKMF